MKYQKLQPSRALDLAYRRQKVTRTALDTFEAARLALLSKLDAAQDEADMVVPLTEFFKAAGLGAYFVNSHKKRDLVMRTGQAVTDPFAIIFELKHQKNKGEMARPDDLNRKALHELLLYYFQERTSEQAALELRQLVITTGYEWFVFDAHEFHRVFWKNAELRAYFQKHQQGQTTAGDTATFYQQAKEYIDKSDAEIRFTYFSLDLRDDKDRRRAPGERGRLWLSKLFSAPHLLKEPFAQDANTLNRAFYEELLYLMGLEEVKDKGRKLIQRCATGRRQRGSLLENTLVQLRAEDMLRNLPLDELTTYGDDAEQQAEGVALALCLTWISRLLFLKLLEGQLRRYHAPHDAPFRFLDPGQLKEYDQLNLLFYRILNRPIQEREKPEAEHYRQVPYLNSSLFEPSALERVTLRISGLDDRIELPLLARGKTARSVLRQEAGTAPPLALSYLLRFLDAYDFASEGGETVQDDDRPLISAAVLGLIFEKINGYRDGSFYTPGFITMYMCRHTLRRAIIRHFNERFGYRVESIEDLREQLDDEPKRRTEFSEAFNELRVCDPAVGSGHFLVSALNELLAIKSELHLLLDNDGRRLRYTLTVARDELAVTSDEDDLLFEYRARFDADGTRHVSKEYTRLQSALFREKRLLIEHCLYGVDLNPNSVRICRLRLWIELLKHAYYTPQSQYQELETLPNLDLNVRAGNSLISRFPLQADLTDVFRRKGTSVADYRRAFGRFFSARGRDAKQELQDFLIGLKAQFSTAIQRHDPLLKRINKVKDDLLRVELDQKPDLFGKAQLNEEDAWARRISLQMTFDKLEAERQHREEGALFRDAFEWRFEFPEILNHDGSFCGFDVIIGNPPYISAVEQNQKQRYALVRSGQYHTLSEKWDLFIPFLELGYQLLADGGILGMIVSDAYCHAKYAKSSQNWFLQNSVIQRLDFFSGFQVFEEASVGSVIPYFEKKSSAIKDQPERVLHEGNFDSVRHLPTAPQFTLTHRVFFPEDQPLQEFTRDTIALSELCYVSVGMVVHADEKIAHGQFELADLVSDVEDEIHSIPFVEGKHLNRWLPTLNKWLEWNTTRAPHQFRRQTFPELYRVPEKLLSVDMAAGMHKLKVCYDGQQLFHNHSVWCFVPWYSLQGIHNKSLQKVARYNNEKVRKDLPQREKLEDNSRLFSVWYLLGIMNSSSARTYLLTNRRSNIHLYPDDWKQLPIPVATPEQQADVATLVEQVLAAKAADAAADTSALEQQIDEKVTALYGLTETEAKLLSI